MDIRFQCSSCGRALRANARYAATRATCPTCGKPIEIPGAEDPPSAPDHTPSAATANGDLDQPDDAGIIMAEIVAAPVREFHDPPAPATTEPAPARASIARRMFEALLDPHSIQWMLIIGGVLAVLGLIIWVVSLGIFENKIVVAVAAGAGTLVMVGIGWLVSLRTRYKTAGVALTFLGCVVAPLNLWYYHAQDLIRVDDHLWIGGVVICALYIATVRVLRKPVFMYAVEIGVSLTVLLLAADLPLTLDAVAVAVSCMILGLISIHSERAFPTGKSEFARDKYGLPLFWSGHVQMGIALIAISKWQIAGLVWHNVNGSSLIAASIWLAAAYAYVYSDVVVRKVGVYVYLAAVALLIALLTLTSAYLNSEVLIAMLAVTALAANLVERNMVQQQRYGRIVAPLGLVLGAVPLLFGWILHTRATSELARQIHWQYETGFAFVGVMALTAVCSRVSAWLYRKNAPQRTVAYLFYSAAAVLIAAAGLLRQLHLEQWTEQAPLLMLVPLAYLLAARLWRGHLEEKPVTWVAHAGTAVILLHGLFSIVNLTAFFTPTQGHVENLLLGIVFVEAALFYILATTFDRSFKGGFFGAAAACAALWQFLGYFQVPPYLHTLLFAVVGLALIIVARVLGVEQAEVYRSSGTKAMKPSGRGAGTMLTGNAILCVAILAALLQGFGRLAAGSGDWQQLLALALTTAASALACVLVSGGGWRRTYGVCTVALAALSFLTLNVLVGLSAWQKAELFLTAAGLILVVFGYVGRFNESSEQKSEGVDLTLFFGGIMATLPVLIAVVYHRFHGAHPSLPDEVAAIAITTLLLLTGVSWRIKLTTLFGGAGLVIYLCILVTALARLQQASQGVYLAIGGAAIFLAGVLLSIYRDRLIALPDRVAKGDGIFAVLKWR